MSPISDGGYSLNVNGYRFERNTIGFFISSALNENDIFIDAIQLIITNNE